MKQKKTIDVFQKLIVPDPVEIVIGQIRSGILSGQLAPGDKLPSERRLEEKIGVPRAAINKAMRMMETYGILYVVPQNGTYISNICVEALDGLISNITALKEEDFDSLADVRMVLEQYAIELAVERASNEDIAELEEIHMKFSEEVASESLGFDKDLVFHLKIASISKNPVLNSVLTKLTVNMIDLFKEFETTITEELLSERLNHAVAEHNEILRALNARDTTLAKKAISDHFKEGVAFNHKYTR